MNMIPVTVQLLDTCTPDYFQGFSGPTIAIPVDARTDAMGLAEELNNSNDWPEGLTDEEVAQAVVSMIGDTALHRNTNLFPDVGPDNPPEGLWISPLPGDMEGWVVIDQEDGAVGGPYPTEKYALCECWDYSDEIEPVYAYFGISLEEPEGYLVRSYVDGHTAWEFVLTDEDGEPLQNGESSDSFNTEMDAKIAAWRDHLNQKADDVRLTADGYHALHDGLSDMIESGRLTEADIPDDYHWLVESLADLGGRNPSDPVRMVITAAEQLVLAYAKAKASDGGSVQWEDIGIAYEYALSGVSEDFLAEVRAEYPEAGL